ncbi:MAG: enoyl-CoA hydratase/isomerase family protein [Pirellulaceae bacterium]|nr:enoyl-CoA hydratase/isomerase family protein [Pirellulaceae bacterium]
MISSDASHPPLKVRVHENIGTVILNREERANALSRQLVNDLLQAFSDLHLQGNVRAIVLTGSGPTFCAGTDLNEIHDSFEQNDAANQWHLDCRQLRDLLETMLRFPKPIIAAVNGPAMGIGASLILAADLVVAAPEATLGAPETQRGLVPGLLAPLLAFRMGAGRAAQVLLRGRNLSASETLQLGIYHEIVHPDKVWAQAMMWAKECSSGATEAIQLTRSLLNETIGESLMTWLSVGAATTAAGRTTESAKEGIAAFLEKREPQWP